MVTQACDLRMGIEMLEGICVPKKKYTYIFLIQKNETYMLP